MESGTLEQTGDLLLGSRSAHEDDRTIRREQRLRPARKPTGETDMRASGQVPGGKILWDRVSRTWAPLRCARRMAPSVSGASSCTGVSSSAGAGSRQIIGSPPACRTSNASATRKCPRRRGVAPLGALDLAETAPHPWRGRPRQALASIGPASVVDNARTVGWSARPAVGRARWPVHRLRTARTCPHRFAPRPRRRPRATARAPRRRRPSEVSLPHPAACGLVANTASSLAIGGWQTGCSP
jgi:hypothetical protein